MSENMDIKEMLGVNEITSDRSRTQEASDRAFVDPLHIVDEDEPRSFAEVSRPLSKEEVSGEVNEPEDFNDAPVRASQKRSDKNSK